MSKSQTVHRVNWCNVTQGDWKERLLELIDADQLPVHWGGTRRGPDGDEYCRPEVITDR